jgi:hypothetical protein
MPFDNSAFPERGLKLARQCANDWSYRKLKITESRLEGQPKGFRIRDSGFRELRWRGVHDSWGDDGIQDSGVRVQGSAIMVVAWFLRKG